MSIVSNILTQLGTHAYLHLCGKGTYKIHGHLKIQALKTGKLCSQLEMDVIL